MMTMQRKRSEPLNVVITHHLILVTHGSLLIENSSYMIINLFVTRVTE